MEKGNVDVNASIGELKAKVSLMELLKCGEGDINWFIKFLANFGVNLRQISMFGGTFNEIVSGVYSSALKFAGISKNLHDVKMVVDMGNSSLHVGETAINSSEDLQNVAYSIGVGPVIAGEVDHDKLADLIADRLTPKIASIISNTLNAL